MKTTRILVIGGYGLFGRLLIERLSVHPHLHITIAGRSAKPGRQLANDLDKAPAEVTMAVLDAMGPFLTSKLLALAPDVVVNASGPFQGQDYRVAQSCIALGMHYLDLADGREFVQSIDSLDSEAKAAGVLVVSGVSTLPALSSAAADRLTDNMATVQTLDIGICPGNRVERGLSTMQAVLSYCGKPVPCHTGETRYGWSSSHEHRYPAPVHSRKLSDCDTPDLVLLGGRYPGRPNVRVGAGLELGLFHYGMNLMSWLTRTGLVPDWPRNAKWLKRISDCFRIFGSDAGAMHVKVVGQCSAGLRVSRTWHLVATHGQGLYVPTLAAAALVRKLAAGTLTKTGAMPCLGLLTLEDFELEAQGLRITMGENLK